MEGGIFLSIKDLQRLLGSESYRTVARQHQALRDILNKLHITVKEYCEYEKLDFEYVWNFLRQKKNVQK